MSDNEEKLGYRVVEPPPLRVGPRFISLTLANGSTVVLALSEVISFKGIDTAYREKFSGISDLLNTIVEDKTSSEGKRFPILVQETVAEICHRLDYVWLMV